MELHILAERNHRGLPCFGGEQLREENPASPEFVDYRSRIRAGLHRDHNVDGEQHPVHLYRLPHIVVVKDQVVVGASPST